MRETLVFEDLLNVLIRLEKNGVRVYSAAAKATPDERVQALLKELAAAERRHLRLFEAWKQAEQARVGATPEDADREYREYLAVLFDSQLAVPDLRRKPRGAGAVLRHAIALEKETILFLTEAEQMGLPAGFRDKLRMVADEERGHIRVINRMAGELGVSLKLAKEDLHESD